MQLTAAQQQDYIQAMGIEPWYPRVKLANAPLPLVAELSEPSVPVESSNSAEPAISVSAPVQTPTAPVAESPRIEVAEPETVQPAASEPAQQTNQEKPIRFGLGLYVYDDWLIASALTADYQNQQEPAAQLITNILQLFTQTPPKLHYHHVISWPFFTNPNASQGVSAASQYVSGVIEHLTEEHGAKKLMVFGGVLPKLQQWTQVEGDDFGMQRIILPSVYKMLVDPAQKRKAWQVIRDSKLYSA